MRGQIREQPPGTGSFLYRILWKRTAETSVIIILVRKQLILDLNVVPAPIVQTSSKSK